MVKSFAWVVNLLERLHSPKKFPEKFWKFRNFPRDILGILGGFILTNSFLRLYVCIHSTFVINSSGRSPRKSGGSPPVLSKNFEILENFGNFWKILENFGNFWKFLKIFWKNVPAEKNFGNFWKFLEKFSKIVKSWKFRGVKPSKKTNLRL
jgi:hypothetical protein